MNSYKSNFFALNPFVRFSNISVSLYLKSDGTKLPKDRASIRSGNLTIKSIKKEDHGTYECVLENEIATLVASTLLLVNSMYYLEEENLTIFLIILIQYLL